MAQFHFKFESVERARKVTELEKLKNLGMAQQKLQIVTKMKNELVNELKCSLERRENLPNSGVFSSEISLEEKFILGLKRKIFQADRAIKSAEEGVTQAMAIFVEARKKHQIVLKLRDKYFEEFKKEQRKREQKLLDDQYIMRDRLSRKNKQ